ncbi:glycosyltransferase family 25 protein [Saccharata proteae CBS 121410]|uniref:Glycosyltransferase family 25 protein n=1 Tax=Saccharata proteae CBS 121410 TaxID=1314787 RepID=A0A9P4LZG7_9PEZI|nr:glycosyltransferase family 25 protein [Saccharata proteae CBS 121410]
MFQISSLTHSRRPTGLAFALLSFTIFALLLWSRGSHTSISFVPQAVRDGTENATLGFETILAVSNVKSWRSDGLQRAAWRTGMRVSIPPQSRPTEDEINEFLGRSHSGTLNYGSAVAWLAHLQVLEMAANHSSTLIMEDDSDWDVAIHSQTAAIAASVRDLTHPTKPADEWPYGENWDVLWLGHCGEKLPEDGEEDYIWFHDSTVPDGIASYEPRIEHPNSTRIVQHAIGPICTFAYAVTAASAQKILAMEHGTEQAFDLFMHTRCKDGRLDCISVNPEVFHHHRAVGLPESLVNAGDRFEGTANSTENIMHSARCNVDSPPDSDVQETGAFLAHRDRDGDDVRH